MEMAKIIHDFYKAKLCSIPFNWQYETERSGKACNLSVSLSLTSLTFRD